MTQNMKDWLQYGSAIGMLISAVVLAYFSFFFLDTIVGSVLAYVSICVAFAGAIYGCSMYIKNQFGEYSANADKKLDSQIEQLQQTIKDLKVEKR